MDNLLLCDQMAGLLDQSQQRIDVLRPLVQHLIGVLGLGKRYDTRWPVNFGIDGLGYHQLGQELFTVLGRQVQQLSKTCC